MKDNFYSRKEILNNNINEVLNRITHNENVNFTANFTEEDYLILKNALGSIHNYLTLNLTFKFIEKLKEIFSNLTDENIETEKNKIDRIGPNTNGFDIKIDAPIKLLAEIKSINPVKEESFGQAQKSSLYDDLYKLKYKETKVKINQADYYKFLVVQNYNNKNAEKAVYKFKELHFNKAK